MTVNALVKRHCMNHWSDVWPTCIHSSSETIGFWSSLLCCWLETLSFTSLCFNKINFLLKKLNITTTQLVYATSSHIKGQNCNFVHNTEWLKAYLVLTSLISHFSYLNFHYSILIPISHILFSLFPLTCSQHVWLQFSAKNTHL